MDTFCPLPARAFRRLPRALRLVALAALFVILATSVPLSAGNVLRVAYPEFWPFYSRNEEGVMVGLFPDILCEALSRRLHVPVRWQAYPWARCQSNLRNGVSDAIVTVPTAERLAYAVTHPTPLYIKSRHIFTYAGHPDMEAIKALRTAGDIRAANLTVITYLGNGWTAEHIAARGVRVEETTTLESVWGMLARRRGDIVIECPDGAWSDIRAAGAQDKVVDTGVVLGAVPFHLMIRKDSPFAAMLPQFDEVIAAMHREGVIRRIEAAYVRGAASPGHAAQGTPDGLK
ncbi:MAG: transporter substrate-binding domain-containing protein [Desulfovibrionaceae bacterium]|nr:transporter substrate-binding domain-containing protein [Desulfovibrionaceae bacterium]